MKHTIGLAMVALALSLTGCNNSKPLADVQVSFATQRPPSAGVAVLLVPADTQVTGTDTLIMTSAAIVLRGVELRPAGTSDCSGTTTCEVFAAGPVIVNLPLSPGIQPQFAVNAPPNTYVEVRFDIHKVSSSDAGDTSFLSVHPDFANISLRVLGTFRGKPFTYTSDLNVTQRLALNPTLVVLDNGAGTNLTVFSDVHGWFRVGGTLVDPNTANKGGANENAVRDNIIASFQAFDDPDGNGAP